MPRRAQLVVTALLALTCGCSLLLYNDDDLAGSSPAAPDAAVDAAGPADASSEVSVADAGADANADADGRAFPATATVWSQNGHAYEVVAVGAASYDVARIDAENRGGHLAAIESAAENAFVFSLASAKPAAWRTTSEGDVLGPWLGAKRMGDAGADMGWTWVTGEPFAYAAWSPGQPDLGKGGAENALHFYAGAAQGSTWNDLEDSASLTGFVVEYE